VVALAQDIARADGCPLIVAMFNPHPVLYFRPDIPPFQLTSLDQRARLFAAAGADATLIFQFDEALRSATPEKFVIDWLIGQVGAKTVVTGPNFSFGRSRSGDVRALAALGMRHGLRAETAAPVMDGDEPVSSSGIRALLRAGRCRAAAALLTRPFTISGVNGHDGLSGDNAGFTWANLSFGNYVRVADGTYAVRAHLADGRQTSGVALVNVRRGGLEAEPEIQIKLADIRDRIAGQSLDLEFLACSQTVFNQLPQRRTEPF
jgi:riboflavin kinase/FMN adenylyltransferase